MLFMLMTPQRGLSTVILHRHNKATMPEAIRRIGTGHVCEVATQNDRKPGTRPGVE
jgi:hypothetical protein